MGAERLLTLPPLNMVTPSTEEEAEEEVEVEEDENGFMKDKQREQMED